MKKPNKPITCWVTDRTALDVAPGQSREAALLSRLREAARAGLDWIQLREKDLETRTLLDLASAAVEISQGASPRDTHARILINDRLDVAWTANAAGVHLGESSLPIGAVAREIRSARCPDFLAGVSCHALDAAIREADDGADYAFFGPVFATPSKASYGEPRGLARLAAVCRAVSIPVLAIGGITNGNFRACLDAGAAGIAAIRLFQQQPAEQLAELVEAIR